MGAPALKKKNGITSGQMKNLAIIIMTLDHIGVCLLLYIYYYSREYPEYHFPLQVSPEAAFVLEVVYYILRSVGRIAFPLFCFMLVQGFQHTGSRIKYLFRLVLFAFISEIPFDLALSRRPFVWDYSNVFFTLSLGLLCIMVIDYLEKRFYEENRRIVIFVLLSAAATAACGGAAWFICSDYSYGGVLAIVIIYLFRKKPVPGVALACAALILVQVLRGVEPSWFEVPCVLSVLITDLYNGRKGSSRPGKYFFYVFYPAHLLIIAGLGRLLIF